MVVPETEKDELRMKNDELFFGGFEDKKGQNLVFTYGFKFYVNVFSKYKNTLQFSLGYGASIVQISLYQFRLFYLSCPFFRPYHHQHYQSIYDNQPLEVIKINDIHHLLSKNIPA